MHILTNRLVKIDGPALPLPWYHRAPLGLLSDTPVHVALQRPRRRPFGDLLVSLVDPVNWPYATDISAYKVDAPGVLANVYGMAPPLNIVFAEGATVDSGTRHDASLIVEPFHPGPEQSPDSIAAGVEAHVASMTASLASVGFNDINSTRLHPENSDLAWMEVGSISLGWAEVGGWREALEAQRSGTDHANFDLETAVVSADTRRRLLRYVFPRKGAVAASVEHADRPGAMEQIAQALASNDLNILSSLLRRGSAPPTKALVVVAVEPAQGQRSRDEVAEVVKGAIGELAPELRARVRVSFPVDAEAVLYPRRPTDIVARPPKGLVPGILAARADLPKGKHPVFISCRFVDPSERYNHDVLQELRDCLADRGFIAVEARPMPGSPDPSSDEVKAKMWASEAAIMLVVSTPDEREFSENLAHECGFMQGQGKPLLPLVQQDVAEKVVRIANLQGLQLSTFQRKDALNRQARASVWNSVAPWLDGIQHTR